MAKLLYHHALYTAMRIVDRTNITTEFRQRASVEPYKNGNLTGLEISWRPSPAEEQQGISEEMCRILVVKNMATDAMQVCTWTETMEFAFDQLTEAAEFISRSVPSTRLKIEDIGL